jgi:hypothetical protein
MEQPAEDRFGAGHVKGAIHNEQPPPAPDIGMLYASEEGIADCIVGRYFRVNAATWNSAAEEISRAGVCLENWSSRGIERTWFVRRTAA